MKKLLFMFIATSFVQLLQAEITVINKTGADANLEWWKWWVSLPQKRAEIRPIQELKNNTELNLTIPSHETDTKLVLRFDGKESFCEIEKLMEGKTYTITIAGKKCARNSRPEMAAIALCRAVPQLQVNGENC
jgi:hypothetical protein